MMTREQYQSTRQSGGLVGMVIHVNGQPVTITDYDYGRYFYTFEGHEYDFRQEYAQGYIADELAMMLWPELGLWETTE